MERSVSAATPLILVVEDNPVERALVERVLANAGFATAAVDSGEAGVRAALEREPDLILLDALLPDIDGFDVCRQLHAHPRSRFIPIMMLTGLDDVASIDRAYEVGATDFLTKPINHSLLVHRVRYLLRATRMMEELRVSRQSLASAQRVARLGHWEYDFDRRRVTLSDELVQLYGLQPDGASSGYAPLLAACHPDDRAALDRALRAMIEGGDSARIEHRLAPRSERTAERVMEMHLARVADGQGGRLLMGICMEITARKESEREILRLAYFDRLTGLPNRSLLELVLDQAIPQAHMGGSAIALLTIDLDLFSRINNALGHSAGDAVLRQVANRLARQVAAPSVQQLLERLSLSMELGCDWPGGLVARLGADTFVVVLRVAPRGAVLREIEAIKPLFQQPFLYRGQEVFITASLGMARSDSAGFPAETLLQQADMALRDAKRQGRNEVREYRGELVAQVATQLTLQSDLRKALRRGEFQVHFQPKLAVRGGAVTGFEALLRWRHPARGMVPPLEFITLAEETGQIVELGRWALLSACDQFRGWLDAGLVHGHVAVNVSARQFREPDLVPMVLGVLEQSGLAPQHLELEITEGVLMSDPRAAGVVAELRSRGISIALDDFGTGFSSLSYLTRFPIDTLKIDRCFVNGVTHLSDQAAIITAVTTLSHRLQLNVVAEGVETEAELQVISELQCDEVQGFLVCRPLAGDAAAAWLKARAQAQWRRKML